VPEQTEIPELAPFDAQFALIVAMTVRNAMEDFHVDNLTDAQMAELNPIIRDAIATALHARTNALRHRAARDYLEFQERLLPNYWEAPELLDDYVESWKWTAARYPNGDERCMHCGRAIVDVGMAGPPRWIHLAADGGTNVGCRTASFESDSGWNDSLDRRWKARPVDGRRSGGGATI
jgi:hypothetical protein